MEVGFQSFMGESANVSVFFLFLMLSTSSVEFHSKYSEKYHFLRPRTCIFCAFGSCKSQQIILLSKEEKSVSLKSVGSENVNQQALFYFSQTTEVKFVNCQYKIEIHGTFLYIT